jgi:hypothetical protein
VSARLVLRSFAALCAVLGVIPLANILTDGRAVPWYGLAVREWLERGLVVIAIAVGLAVLLGSRLDAVMRRAKTLLLRPTPLAFGATGAAFAFLAALFVAQWSFAGQPFTSDEMAQQWHARVLLSGRVAALAEANPEFFNTAPVFDRDGRWFSQYPIGAVAFIALGTMLGAAWLVNPLLLALATWMLYRWLAEAADELTGRVTTLLFVFSPMVLIMSGSQMNHVPALVFTLVALRALARWDRAGDRRTWMKASVAVGASIGIVALVRPLDAAVVALVVGGFQLWRIRDSSERARSLAVQVIAGAVPIALLLWANARTTGAPFLFGYEALNGPEHALGFHVDPNGEPHTPARGLAFASGYLLRLSRYLFEWPIPGLIVVAAGAAAIRRASRWDVLLVALASGILIAYGAYWFDGFFAGPRFLFTALPAFVYFAARAPIETAGMTRHPVARRALTLVVPLCIAGAWLGPQGDSGAAARVSLYRDQRTKLKTDIEAQVERAELRNALVLINESWRGRLLARLRALGLTQFRAERTLNTVDACALQTALDAEDTLVATSMAQRAERVVQRARAYGNAERVPGLDADQALALVRGSAPTPTCLREFTRDSEGTIPYALLLARQTIGTDGRVGGNVVYARDLGDRNELLRSRFGDRAWYRYRPARALGDTSFAFMPYRPAR